MVGEYQEWKYSEYRATYEVGLLYGIAEARTAEFRYESATDANQTKKGVVDFFATKYGNPTSTDDNGAYWHYANATISVERNEKIVLILFLGENAERMLEYLKSAKNSQNN